MEERYKILSCHHPGYYSNHLRSLGGRFTSPRLEVNRQSHRNPPGEKLLEPPKKWRLEDVLHLFLEAGDFVMVNQPSCSFLFGGEVIPAFRGFRKKMQLES